MQSIFVVVNTVEFKIVANSTIANVTTVYLRCKDLG